MLGHRSSSPYTCDMSVTTTKASNGRLSTYPAKPEAVQNIIGMKPNGRIILNASLSCEARPGYWSSGKNSSHWGPTVPRRKPCRKMCIDKKHTTYANGTEHIWRMSGLSMRAGGSGTTRRTAWELGPPLRSAGG